LEDDLNVLRSKEYDILQRTTDILNPFLDKYRLFLEDYRTENISVLKNFFFATCHSSPLSVDEQTLTVEQLLSGLSKGRTFYRKLGHGGANILRPNSFDRLGPKAELGGTQLEVLASFFTDQYEMPLSYDLIMLALRSLQIDHDFKLTIVHAATAVEVHVLHLLHNLLKASGKTDTEAWNLLENDPEYEGVTKRLKRLESHAKDYCNIHGISYKPFVGTRLYNRWKDVLAHKRNRAVHAGVASFSWTEATEALGIAKETIGILDQRIPSLANRLQLTPSVTGIFEGSGGIRF
jgi:hypothetical protein